MRKLLHAIIPGLPPTVNHLYRTSGNNKRYKTREGKAWQNETALLFKAARREAAAYNGDVALDIVFHVADERRWDIDNRVKALQDCVEMAGVIGDDVHVEDVHFRRLRGEDRTETEISVIALGEGGRNHDRARS